MTLLDERGRLFGRINVIDFIVVLLILLAVGKLGYDRLGTVTAPGQTDQTMEVTVLVERVRPNVADVIREQDSVREGTTTTPVGEVVAVDVTPARVLQLLPDGSVREAELTHYVDVWITIRGAGLVTPNVILFGGREIRVGSRLDVTSLLWGVEATVTGIDLDPPTRSGDV